MRTMSDSSRSAWIERQCCVQEPWLGDHDASLPKIHIGICAMDKKAHSRPMKAIVDRLETYGEFEITYFGDDTILEKPIAEWPSCDCLLSWHSDGFPLAKVNRPLQEGPAHMHPVTTIYSSSACRGANGIKDVISGPDTNMKDHLSNA